MKGIQKSIILAIAILGFGAQTACPPDPKPPAPDGGDASAPDAAPPPAPDAAPPPPKDAGPSDDFDLACVALKVAGCPEGNPPNCAAAMRTNQGGHINDYHPKDVKACSTKSCVRSASKGSVACP